ncbi:14703_t:CDS:1, partial [Gigaspora rosea]
KAVGSVFNKENKYQDTIKGFEMYKFAKLFFTIEECSSSLNNFMKEYNNLHEMKNLVCIAKFFVFLIPKF